MKFVKTCRPPVLPMMHYPFSVSSDCLYSYGKLIKTLRSVLNSESYVVAVFKCPFFWLFVHLGRPLRWFTFALHLLSYANSRQFSLALSLSGLQLLIMKLTAFLLLLMHKKFIVPQQLANPSRPSANGYEMTRAGHFRYFFYFFTNKK